MLTSVSSADQSLCVDLFEDPAGNFGLEHFRSDPEDGGRWTAIGGFAGSRFESRSTAAQAARGSVAWLNEEPGARASIAARLTRPEPV